MMVEMLVNKSGWRIKGVARLYKVTYGRGLAKALRRYSKNLMVYPLSVVHEPSGLESLESGGALSPSPLEPAREQHYVTPFPLTFTTTLRF